MSLVSVALTAPDVASSPVLNSSALAPRWGKEPRWIKERAEDWLYKSVLPRFVGLDYVEFWRDNYRVIGCQGIALHHAHLTIGHEDYLTVEFSFIGEPQLRRYELDSLVTPNLPEGSVLDDGLKFGWAPRQGWIPEGISAYGKNPMPLEKAIRELRGQIWVQKARYRLLYPRFVDFPAENCDEYPLVEDRFVPALGVQGLAPGHAGARGHSPRR